MFQALRKLSKKLNPWARIKELQEAADFFENELKRCENELFEEIVKKYNCESDLFSELEVLQRSKVREVMLAKGYTEAEAQTAADTDSRAYSYMLKSEEAHFGAYFY